MPVDRSLVPSAWGSRQVRETRYLAALEGKSAPWDLAGPSVWGQTYGTGINYASEAGDVRLSSIVMACMNWILTNWGYITPFVERTADGGETWERVPGHPATALLTRPNPFYSGALLLKPLVLDWSIGGNAYIRKEYNASKRLVELWYEPAATIRPRWDSTAWITHYDLWRNNHWEPRPPDTIIHLRHDMDPDHPRLGLSPLASALRQIYTDKGVENFNALLLRNLGMAGVVISPSGPGEFWTPEQGLQLKALFQNATAGDERGMTVAMLRPMKLDYTSRTPAELQIQEMSDQPEERISGLLNIHPAVVGLGVGLEHSTYSNMGEAIRAAYRGNLMPTGMAFADELTQQFLGDLGNPETERVGYDFSRLPENATNKVEAATVATQAYDKGVATLNEARKMLGLPPLEGATGDVFKAPAPAAGFGFGGVSGPPDSNALSKALAEGIGKALTARQQARMEADVSAYLATQYDRAAANVRNGSG